MSLWDSIWDEETPILEIENQRYQFILAPNGSNSESTSVTILDKNGEPVPSETLERVFPVIEPGLSFRDVY